MSRLPEAEDSFRAAIEANPRDTASLNNLGVIQVRQGHIGEAVRTFQRVLEIEPANPDARRNLDALWTAVGPAKP